MGVGAERHAAHRAAIRTRARVPRAGYQRTRFGQRLLDSSKCTAALQAVCSSLQWFPARPLRGGLPTPRTAPKKRLRRAPEALFGGVRGG
eukprot:12082174-Alexandrium_andersonii.AAC.1